MHRFLAILLACLHLHAQPAPDPLPADPSYVVVYPPDLGGPWPQTSWQAHAGVSYDGHRWRPTVHVVAGN